ncbi:NAD(P)-binding protein [Parathielavia appendiculata]|uniref:NAD(P)-binding protein n=1 Tax=Parathielavia appendiculata TaxID=2587402 RepID=A0AAN6TT58_9PEZI|nr:NAD(P)-binding protein [Parathielavia appendiculata]
MKSWTATSWGTPRQSLILDFSAPIPSLPCNSKSFLLKISHVSLNPADLVLLKSLPPWLPFRRNPVPGMDFAGEIVAVGDAVPAEMELKEGDKVCGALGLWDVARGKGTLAEFVVVESSLVAKVPAKWGPKTAAGLMGISGQTAAVMARSVASPRGSRGGGWVLVNGATGGVGSVLVQICRGLGAQVVAVCSGENEELVKALGATEVIDYRAHEPLEEHLADVFRGGQLDAIFDCVGSQALYTNSPRYLKTHGKFINIVGGWSQGVIPFIRNKLRPLSLGGTPRNYELFLLSASGKAAREVAAWVEKGVIKGALIDSEFPMEQAIEAFEKLATGRAKGKIVVNVESS